MTTEVVNAIIEHAEITYSRGVFLDAWVTLNYGNSGVQGFGGWALYKKDESPKGPNFAGYAIGKILEVAGVEKWSHVKGKAVRVKRGANWGDTISAIGHITKDIWYEPKKDFEVYKETA